MSVAISHREASILKAVISAYTYTGKPVGSKYVAMRFNRSLSPASIRNVMMALEAKGLLFKPHTSAGRVPTEEGYRVYVNRIMRPRNLSQSETRAIRRALGEGGTFTQALEEVSKVLESLSHCIGVVLAKEHSGRITCIEISRCKTAGILLRVEIDGALSRSVVLNICDLSNLSLIEGVLAEWAQKSLGLQMDEATRILRQATTRSTSKGKQALKSLRHIAALLDSGDYDVHLFGAANLICSAQDPSAMGRLVSLLERKNLMARAILDSIGSGGVTVSIGRENTVRELRQFSLVAAPYSTGVISGAVAVIGPVRMEYARIVPLVDYTASRLVEFFNR